MLDFLRKIYKKQGSIWKYADFYAEKIDEGNRLMLGDGGTELLEDKDITKIFNTKCNTPRLSRPPLLREESTHPIFIASDKNHSPLEGNDAIHNACPVEHLYFKREDQNECGSIKGRSLCYQVSLNKQRGEKALVISTSGNAGIAAAAYARRAGMKLFVFLSPDTEKGKIVDMQKYDPVIIRSRRAMRLANYAAVKYELPNLRPSIDDDSIEGFKSIAFEIADEAGDVDAVFTFVTSGSSFVGMYRGFEAYVKLEKIKKIPRMYAVQSGEIHSIAEKFEGNSCLIKKENYGKDILMQDTDLPADKKELRAGKFGVRNTRRKKEILDIIEKTEGKGIYAGEKEVEEARTILAGHDIKTSLEGCASFAGFIKMQEEEKFRNAVCILSGKLRDRKNEIEESKMFFADNFEDIDRIMKNVLKV